MVSLLAGDLAPLILLFMFASGFAMFFLPFLAWSAARNLKQIRMQFERLNDSLDARASERPTGTFGR